MLSSSEESSDPDAKKRFDISTVLRMNNQHKPVIYSYGHSFYAVEETSEERKKRKKAKKKVG
jgi:hypothetical protein